MKKFIKIKNNYICLKAMYKEALKNENNDPLTIEFEKRFDKSTWEEGDKIFKSKEYLDYIEEIERHYQTSKISKSLIDIEKIIIDIGLKFFKKVKPTIAKDIEDSIYMVDVRNKFINLTLRSPLFN